MTAKWKSYKKAQKALRRRTRGSLSLHYFLMMAPRLNNKAKKKGSSPHPTPPPLITCTPFFLFYFSRDLYVGFQLSSTPATCSARQLCKGTLQNL
ncbi:hypothetical protein YC2023_070910 [Brassica napus]